MLNVGADAEPVFVAARLPAEIGDLELRPVAPTVNDLAQRTLPWVLWGIGAVLAALGTADLLLRVAPQWRSTRRRARAPWEGNTVAEAYRALRGNVASGVEPRRLLHQMDHIVRLTLASKDGLDWLEEPSLEMVHPSIREKVTSLLDKCEEAYKPAQTGHDEVAEMLEAVDTTLGFYFGEREVAAWRS